MTTTVIGSATLHLGDCLDVLRTLPDASIEAIVTDPPYGLAFMGKHWDYDVPAVEVWQECLRVLKPGGHLLAFAGTRTFHRMAVRIEDAGFEIRDMIAWVYGSGFPKSLDVSKAIDKAAGAEREVVGSYAVTREFKGRDLVGDASHGTTVNITAPATPAARQWSGWGTALKPALEPIALCRKPLDGTVSKNVLANGTGALNIDGCRVETSEDCARKPSLVHDTAAGFGKGAAMGGSGHDAGRWPANLIHDGSDEVVALFPETKNGGDNTGSVFKHDSACDFFSGTHARTGTNFAGDTGSAARFFYCAKADQSDRDEGCHDLPEVLSMRYGEKAQGPLPQQTPSKPVPQRNHHPTVKPTDLMRYLCRLVTPPGGTILDPFMGSGSTGRGAALEGFHFIGIEREPDYLAIAQARIKAAQRQPDLFHPEAVA